MSSATDYRQLVEQAPIMVWRSDLSGACDYVDERWLEFTGRTLAQELGDGWASGVHGDDLARCFRVYRESFVATRTFELEYRLRRHDGVYRWIFVSGIPRFDAAGAFCGYVGRCVDVNARVEAEHSTLAPCPSCLG